MSGWLLDTNILSELRRPQPNPKVIDFVARQSLSALFISTVTFAEIRFGIEQITDLEKRTTLETWLTMQLRPMFEGRILPINEETMLIWRRLVEQGRKQGHTFPQPDLIIAATALQYDFSVVSRDTGGYAKTGVRLLNPWA
jgi:predicted nucleic acid-binding protein